MHLINHIISTIDTLTFFIFNEIVAIGTTLYVIALLSLKKAESQTFLSQIKWFLIVILFSSVAEDLSWLVNILKISLFPNIDLRLIVFLIRIAWILSVVQYQAFSLFIEHLIPSQSKFFLIINKLTLAICIAYCAVFTWLILFNTYSLGRPPIEIYIFKNISYVYMPIMILICLVFTLISLSDHKIPSVLRKLLYTFTLGLIGPTIAVDLIHICEPIIITSYFKNSYTLIGILSLFIAAVSFLCIKHILYLDCYE